MKFKHFIFIFLFLTSIFTFAQTSTDRQIIQELKVELDTTVIVTDQIKINLQLAKIYLNYNADTSIKYCKEIKKLMRRTTPPPILLADINKTWGDALYKSGDKNNAIKKYTEQLEVLNDANINADSVLFNLATIEYERKDYANAATHYEQLIDATTDENLKARLYQSLYKVQKDAKNYEQALNALNSYLEIVDKKFYDATQKISILSNQVTVTKTNLYTKQVELNQTQNVLNITADSLSFTSDSLVRVSDINDSLSIQQKIIIEKKARHGLVLKHKTTELNHNQVKFDRQETELAARKKIISLLIIIIFIIIAAGSFIFILYQRIIKKNIILKQQKIEIQKQSALIKDKNRLITESILYASRIQQSILPPTINIYKYLPETFIYYRPRDIVSGDFYWFSKIDNKILISAIDCTGHGVPGAFISMIGNTLLNQIVKENKVAKPSEVLLNLHEEMKKALQQTGSNVESEDGMDMVFCSIEPLTKTLTFAGAKNSLLIYDGEQFNSLKADFISIG
ncbi:MAG: SpoIIE family protein phosphatase [Bacteroidales bacterium]|nr:SpoIIE family protein phosphatase [Bacteroidales bacterium]